MMAPKTGRGLSLFLYPMTCAWINSSASAQVGEAATLVTESTTPRCVQPGEVALPVTDFLAFPQPGAAAAVRAGIRHIRQMIDARGLHHTFGIANFDSDLIVLEAVSYTHLTLPTKA